MLAMTVSFPKAKERSPDEVGDSAARADLVK